MWVPGLGKLNQADRRVKMSRRIKPGSLCCSRMYELDGNVVKSLKSIKFSFWSKFRGFAMPDNSASSQLLAVVVEREIYCLVTA